MMLFVMTLMFFLVLILVFSLLVMNFGVIVLSLKMFFSSFFSDWEVLLSVWNLLFLLMVLCISTSVLIFCFSYMNSLKVINFLLLYVSFVVSMLWLVLNNNFYWMMFGWDGLGVVSFLLIVFYMNHESINNGLFTIFQNRIGDLFFVFFILGTSMMVMGNNLVLMTGLLFLVLGSIVKSAQFPFNSWLLSAMSAPTPISSLVHSSTLVVAGVYILLQYNYCLYDVLEILKFIALMSLIFSFLGLVNESDMKKLIAYSTMNHVSLMMYLLSFKLFKITYFHLNIHAMFKSMMFMCFGFVMLVSFHAQDKRLVVLTNLNPLIKVVYYFSCLCLAGLPFLSAFFSKDLIIEKMMLVSFDFFYVIMLLMFLGVSMYYSLKLMSLYKNNNSQVILEVNFFSMFSVCLMMIVSMLFVNLFLTLVFSVSLEFMSFKVTVYMFMAIFFMFSLLTNLNYKFVSFEKTKSFFEGLNYDYYGLDKFVYWTMMNTLVLVDRLSMFKLILLVNWWMLFIFVVLY